MEVMLIVAQVGIAIFGSVAFLLITREEVRLQKLGVILGIVSNPFWWLMVVATAQWLTIPVHVLYTYGWLRKAWWFWWRPASKGSTEQ